MSDIIDHTSRDHAEFSPSSLKYVAGCGGYHGRDGTRAAAEKGTRIHEALEVHDPSALHNEEELEIYEQIVRDEELFLASIISSDDFANDQVEELNEIQVNVELDGTSTWGTCDRLTIYGSKSDKAIMGDYKTGISIIDSPKENWQAKAYTLGAFQRYPDLKEVIFVFYIPVRGEVIHDTFIREDMPTLRKELTDVIKRGELIRPQWGNGKQPDMDDLTPTVNCRFCRHEDHCPALGGMALEVASRVASTIPMDADIDDPEDPEVVEQLYAVAKIVINWGNQLKSKAVEMAKDGVEFPTLRLKSMGATRKCTNNTKLLEIANSFDIDANEIIDLASLPLKKVADSVGRKAPEGEKIQKSKDFLDALEEAAIIKTSDTRYTLS